VISHLAAITGVIALGTAIAGAVSGLASYMLYEAELIGADAGANLIIVSVLGALAAVPIGVIAWRLARRGGRDTRIALSGLWLGVGTLGSWFVVVTVALGK
jgi:hypothetical protein